ncbi:hypothetical protein WOLCODRAFT_101511 [Wolfiporia cocos MD-104 SS10]|uniref:DUF6535 domain-containing protein n=1 Tax=Wolfiporia cocos (strain MD-104) TaxID=742152 RepID=A0A2H3JZC1_WOLCO|nr:hypothetical protein WOLCODRAFT_101511 [Wolfiporia cocos MD-104 SS10]
MDRPQLNSKTSHDNLTRKSSVETLRVDSVYLDKDGSRADNWSTCERLMKEYDQEKVKMWKEDIDTLLVFAGLFSAVVTTFSAQSLALMQSNLAGNSSLLATPRQAGETSAVERAHADVSTTSQPWHVPAYALRMNILWYASLVCSLLSAMIGILAKQWLREYTSHGSSSSREAVRLRQHRYNSLIHWHVPEIIASIPLVLEFSVILFLIGLLELLWSVHQLLAAVISAFVAASLAFYLLTMILPAIWASCPYKSPQSWVFMVCTQRCYKWLSNMFARLQAKDWYRRGTYSPMVLSTVPIDWRERDIASVSGNRFQLDGAALAWCYASTSDGDVRDAIIPCIRDVRPAPAVDFVFSVLAEAVGCSIPTLIDAVRSSKSIPMSDLLMIVQGPRGTARLIRMLLYVLPKVPHGTAALNPIQSFDASHAEGVELLDAIQILRQLLMGSARAFCEDPLHRQVIEALAELANEWEPTDVQRASIDLLWDLTSTGCNLSFCPSAIGNILICARTACLSEDWTTFCTACAVALTRLPALRLSPQEYTLYRRIWLDDWLIHVERYFRHCNTHKLAYDASVRSRWCTGLVALARSDPELLSGAVFKTLRKGVRLGLVGRNLGENDAWNDLQEIYSQFNEL